MSSFNQSVIERSNQLNSDSPIFKYLKKYMEATATKKEIPAEIRQAVTAEYNSEKSEIKQIADPSLMQEKMKLLQEISEPDRLAAKWKALEELLTAISDITG